MMPVLVNPWLYMMIYFTAKENYHRHSAYINKTREEQVIITVDFHQNLQFHVCHLEMQKHVQRIIQRYCHYPNTSIPIQFIMFITKYINPLDILNISPYHPPETITKVSTTERNIIHNMKKQINNVMMVITGTCRNTAYPITNTNYPMVPHLHGFLLQHIMTMVSCLQV